MTGGVTPKNVAETVVITDKDGRQIKTTEYVTKQGQVIAKVGSTGYSTGSHLHFEVIHSGVRVDALRFCNCFERVPAAFVAGKFLFLVKNSKITK